MSMRGFGLNVIGSASQQNSRCRSQPVNFKQKFHLLDQGLQSMEMKCGSCILQYRNTASFYLYRSTINISKHFADANTVLKKKHWEKVIAQVWNEIIQSNLYAIVRKNFPIFRVNEPADMTGPSHAKPTHSTPTYNGKNSYAVWTFSCPRLKLASQWNMTRPRVTKDKNILCKQPSAAI